MSRRFFFISGEDSGNNILLNVLLKLKEENPTAAFFGIGNKMIEDAGFNLLFYSNKISYIGISEVIKNFLQIFFIIKKTINAIIKFQPDIVITVDSHSFCYRVMKKVKQKNNKIRSAHIVAPSVWAYNKSRAEKVSKVYDVLFCLLPFEMKYFQKYNLKSIFIGNVNIERIKKEISSLKNIKKTNSICITIGSRISEIKRHKKLIYDLISKMNAYDQTLIFNILATHDTHEMLKDFKNISNINILTDEKLKIKAKKQAQFAIAKSGTNALELSIYNIPMIVYYKTSFVTYILTKLFIKIKFITLINIIMNKNIIPEFIQNDANVKNMYNKIMYFFQFQHERDLQVKFVNRAIKKMTLDSNESYVEIILKNLYEL